MYSLPAATVMCLGAGQDVGKSCVLVRLGDEEHNALVMFDCGMHMGYLGDDRWQPDFSAVDLTDLACIVISHFHLDHIGALPAFTEQVGFGGPIYMTYPTKAMGPHMLEDFRRTMESRFGQRGIYSSDMIRRCFSRVTAVGLDETVHVDGSPDLKLRAFPAGHVLGAAMFAAQFRGRSVVYTGDYNMVPERHLSPASLRGLNVQPDILITESTYATTTRDSRRAGERAFLQRVRHHVERGGKVLLPVFALGRAQELCILLDEYWERIGLSHVPIYFSAGLASTAMQFYRSFSSWTSSNLGENAFDFKHLRKIPGDDRSVIHSSGPAVLLATPGFLAGGLSLRVFRAWAHDKRNLIVFPGRCIAGTVGARLQKGVREFPKYNLVVKCAITEISLSAHVDSKGILMLSYMAQPKHICLVHGERDKMEDLAKRIEIQLGIRTSFPANLELLHISDDDPARNNVRKRKR